MIKGEETMVNSHRPSLAPARPLAYQVLRDGRAREADLKTPYSVLRYGIAGLGTGDASQIADAQGGRGGVGISSPFPCLDGEQLGSVAGLQVMQLPVKVSLLGYGAVKPSVSVSKNATIWSSSLSVKPSIPVVWSRLFETSFIGQQVTLSIVPGGQCPEVTGKGNTSRVL